MNKKGAGEDIAWPEIIFIVLLLAFMAVFFLFVKNNLSGALVEEEVYAKKIALLIDSAQPNTTIFLEVSELNKIAMKSGETKEYYRDIVKLNRQNHSVDVSLRLGSKKYSYSYFSEYSLSDSWDVYLDKDGKQKITYILKVNENE
ncbi:MAG: hypothetical protein WCI72_01855 [archaeon]